MSSSFTSSTFSEFGSRGSTFATNPISFRDAICWSNLMFFRNTILQGLRYNFLLIYGINHKTLTCIMLLIVSILLFIMFFLLSFCLLCYNIWGWVYGYWKFQACELITSMILAIACSTLLFYKSLIIFSVVWILYDLYVCNLLLPSKAIRM